MSDKESRPGHSPDRPPEQRTATLAAYEWAWGQTDLTQGEKFTLVALCDFVGKSTVVYPKLETLQQRTGIKKRDNQRRHLKSLEAKGLIVITAEKRWHGGERTGPQTSNRYTLLIPHPHLYGLAPDDTYYWQQAVECHGCRGGRSTSPKSGGAPPPIQGGPPPPIQGEWGVPIWGGQEEASEGAFEGASEGASAAAPASPPSATRRDSGFTQSARGGTQPVVPNEPSWRTR